MNLLLWTGIIVLVFNLILLIYAVVKSHQYRNLYVITFRESPPKWGVITPNELRESAWESWNSAHPDANPLEQNRARWVIEKEAHKLQRRNRQRHPFADPQKKPR